MAHPDLRPENPNEKDPEEARKARKLLEDLKNAGAQDHTLDPSHIIMSTQKTPKANYHHER